MSRSPDPYLLVIRSGPTWDIESGLLHFAETFARAYDGEVITRSGREAKRPVGRFRIWAIWSGPGGVRGLLHRALYSFRIVARGIRLRWWAGRRLVVIAYDPFQSGLPALLLRWLTRATFICEVNGVYWHPDTFLDIADPREAEAKRRRMIRIASFVLPRAQGIKLLFPGQLAGFDLPPNGPPWESFHELVNDTVFQPTGRPPEPKLIFVGHPYHLKGVDLLLEAFRRVSGDFPEWRLLVVGWRVEESAHGAEFPRDRVEFRGPQLPEVIRELIQEASGLVLPSRSEAMGRVLLEAAFLARPRIGSRAGGIPQVIEDGVDGYLFDSGDVDDLERVLRRFMGATAAQRRDMGEAARSRALREFTMDEYLRRYRELIERASAHA